MANLDGLLEKLLSGDDHLAEEAALQLALHGEPARQRIQPLLRSAKADHRWWAVRSLGAFKDPEVLSLLVDSLEDPEAEVRQCAALVFRNHPSKTALPVLIRSLADPDRLTARLAGDALAALGPDAVHQLALASKDSNPGVRIEAVRALAETEHPDAIGPLFLAIDDPSTLVSHWAEEGLDRLGIGMVFFQP